MKNQKFLLIAALIMLIVMVLSSCVNEEDPGPLQADERNYSLLDFDRLEMGEAFVITVTQSPVYSIRAHGDRRNLDDLIVEKVGNTLKIKFDDSGNRDYTTYIDITMPLLAGVHFSGASNSSITGFEESGNFDIILSGASISQVELKYTNMNVNLSGASKLTVTGKADYVQGRISGASELNAYKLTVDDADVDASGASKVKVYAVKTLKAVASGASTIFYRGTAVVNVSTSGASLVMKD